MRPARTMHRSAGFTLIELVITVGLISVLLASIFPLLTTSNRLSEDSRHSLRVESEQRRNLLAVARALQGIDLTTLENVDPLTGTTNAPAFSRVTGVKDGVRTLGDVEEILWEPSKAVVPGVQDPGDLWLVRDGAKSLLAARVPKDGFTVLQEGRTLRITLTTYYPMAERFRTVTSSTAVAVRN